MHILWSILEVAYKGLCFVLRPFYVHVIRRHWFISSVLILLAIGKLLNAFGGWLAWIATCALLGLLIYKWFFEPYALRMKAYLA